MLKDVLGLAGDARVTVTNQTLMLNLAQRELCLLDGVPWTEAGADLSIVAGTRTTPVPAVPLLFSRPWAVQYTDPADSEQWITVLERDYDWILTEYGKDAAQSSGDPLYYAVFDDAFTWAPTPDENFAARLTYHGIIPDLAADGDSNDLTNRWWPLLLYKACALTSVYMLEDERAIAIWEPAFQRELNRVRAETNSRLRAGGEVMQLQEPG